MDKHILNRIFQGLFFPVFYGFMPVLYLPIAEKTLDIHLSRNRHSHKRYWYRLFL